MDRPGRNEPCYCGSGKKYKQCHMVADLAADREGRAWADAARDLRLAIFEFADDARFEDEAGPAAARYWNEYYSAETLPLMSPGEAERFLDWFAFDYTLPSAGERVVDIYRKEQGENLSLQQRELLAQWADGAPLGGYELTGYERQTLRLKEFLSGEMIDVFEPGGHGNAPLGSIILGRPVRVQDQYEFFSLPAYIPPEEIADLHNTLTAAAGDGATDNEALRRHNVLYIHPVSYTHLATQQPRLLLSQRLPGAARTAAAWPGRRAAHTRPGRRRCTPARRCSCLLYTSAGRRIRIGLARAPDGRG